MRPMELLEAADNVLDAYPTETGLAEWLAQREAEAAASLAGRMKNRGLIEMVKMRALIRGRRM